MGFDWRVVHLHYSEAASQTPALGCPCFRIRKRLCTAKNVASNELRGAHPRTHAPAAAMQ